MALIGIVMPPRRSGKRGVVRVAAVLVVALCGLAAGCAQARRNPSLLLPKEEFLTTPERLVTPPALKVDINDPDGVRGYVFTNSGASVSAADGPLILDKLGRPVWFYSPPNGEAARDFRVQTYRGKKVLTWWQGTSEYVQFGNWHGTGVDYIVDDQYRVIATVNPPEGRPDGHEFRLTPDGNALITVHKKRPADLTALGGPRDAQIWDCLVLLVDVATNQTIFRWDAFDHVPLTDAVVTLDNTAEYRDGVFNPYQLNSVSLAPDGNLLVSMRNTSTLYLVNVKNGTVLWRLGGKRSTFLLGPGVQFANQHDAHFEDAHVIVLFNDNSDGTNTHGPSSAQWIRLDSATNTATLVRNQTLSTAAQATATGNVETLANGNTFIGWGNTGEICELSPTGRLVYDARFPESSSYRAYLEDWDGRPHEDPTLKIDIPTRKASVTWNGATRVRKWRLLGGATETGLKSVITVDWNGIITGISLPEGAAFEHFYQVQALDDDGAILASTAVIRS